MHRFYCPDLQTGLLEGEEVRHAQQVLRLKKESICTVFDGRGKEQKVKLTSVSKHRIEFSPLSSHTTPKAPFHLNLVQALPKSKAMDFIVQKATELGVHAIYPLISERTVVKISDDRSDQKQDKWQNISLEACKQCGQNWLPEIFPAVSLSEYLSSYSPATGLKLIASLQPEARDLHTVIREAKERDEFENIHYLVGPEGDFTPSEIGQALGAGYLPVSLGPTVLRTETASLFLTSALIYELQSAEVLQPET